ncbi:MAG: hypothetical protein CMJ18_19790 [Phycisphaeraceae bacterium]|nr:hypothetical protein [Phycisphaeraceae bacterium]
MPLYHGPDELADWCELRHYEIVRLEPGQTHRFAWMGPKEKVIVGSGRCQVRCGDRVEEAEERANLDLAGAPGAPGAPERVAHFTIARVDEPTVIVRMCGRWGEEVGGSGIFAVANITEVAERGDPAPYEKTTRFDNHWHDCDEYWIAFEGSAEVMSEGRRYPFGPGDCVATGTGHHHDVPRVIEPLRAIYFETTMLREKRRGHLWEHEHGPARPDPAKV